MKQIVRRVIDKKGKVAVIDLPEPHMGPDQILVETHYSLISSGTELSTLAKTPAELVRQTISDPWMRHVVKTTVFATGISQTARRVWQEMIMPREIGYSGAGRVLAIGERVEGFRVGEKVAFAGAGHAQTTAPNINHIAAVPENVDLRHASFVTVGAIVIQALRRADIQFGETITVYGMGLLGQLCSSVAKAAGCVVIGIDVNDSRLQLAQECGVDLAINPRKVDLQRRIMDFTGKHGADATIICAASKSDEIINSSMEITRKQGRVVIVGYVGLNIHPKNFLHREIDLRYSRAFGPGSYHNAYETGRVDYPFGYIRWTEKRNLQEFIRLVSSQAVDLEPFVGATFRLDEVQRAFDSIQDGSLPGLAALIDYSPDEEPNRLRTLEVQPRPKAKGKVGISIIGCGNHVLGKHLPNLQAMRDVEIRGLASATGKNASMVASRIKATLTTTDVGELLADPSIDGVMICSGQPNHYEHIRMAVEARVPMYVEKPMVTLLEDFQRIAALMEQQPILLGLGLNRRYSPMIDKLRETIEGPVDYVQYLVTQPYLPPDHWTLDEVDGGGRLITEGEHFIDLCNLLIGRKPKTVYAQALGQPPEDIRKLCNYAITLYYEDAVASVVFTESGAAKFPRERVTVLARGQVAELEDFSKLTFHDKKRWSYGRGTQREMGHKQAVREFVAALRGQPNRLLTWPEASEPTLCMFAAQESIRSGEPVDLRQFAQILQPGGSE